MLHKIKLILEWIKRNIKESIIAGIVILAVIILLILTTEFWVAPFVIIMMFIGYLKLQYDEAANRSQQSQDDKCTEMENLFKLLLFTWIQEFGRLFNIHQYKDIQLIPPCKTKLCEGGVIFEYSIMKESAQHTKADDLELMKCMLQRFINDWEDLNKINAHKGNGLFYVINDIENKGLEFSLIVSAPLCNTLLPDISNTRFNISQRTTQVDTMGIIKPPAVCCISGILLNQSFYEMGLIRDMPWLYLRFAHLLVFGSTGSGKSYFVKQLINATENCVKHASVFVLDFKADDFSYLAGCKNYYSYMDCTEGFNRFYDEFTARQQGLDSSKSFKMMVFDEWASYLNMLDKKEADQAKQKLSTLLMLGRSFNVHVVISQQRADAEYFAKARDNFGLVVALGNISKESKAMFFGDHTDEMMPVSEVGHGYALQNCSELHSVRVPEIQDMTILEEHSRACVDR